MAARSAGSVESSSRRDSSGRAARRTDVKDCSKAAAVASKVQSGSRSSHEDGDRDGRQARPVYAADQGHGRYRTHGDLIDRVVHLGATLSYQWYRNGKAIAGATKWNYPIVAADKGTSLSVHVTERKTGYVPVTVVSASVLVH